MLSKLSFSHLKSGRGTPSKVFIFIFARPMANSTVNAEIAHIERLNGSNCDIWVEKITHALIVHRLDYVLEKAKPVIIDRSSDVDKKLAEKWESDNKVARSTILMLMDDNLMKIFKEHQTAKLLLEAIKEKYDIKSHTHVQLMLQRYNHSYMKEGVDVVEHVNQMMLLARDLEAAGVPISEKMQVSTIINSLPPSWNMVQISMHLIVNSITMKDLPHQLAYQQECMKGVHHTDLNFIRSTSLDASEAFTGKNFQNNSPQKPKSKFKPQNKNFKGKGKSGTSIKGPCFKCKQMGHIKAECPRRNNGQSGGSSKDLIIVTECNFSSPVSDGWWIDSGATKHIARTRQGMVESKAVNPKEYRIYMGNDAYTEVQAIGTYKLNVGTYNIVLTEVLYAPGMRRNLISVPMLVKKGYDVRFYRQQKLGFLTVTIGKHGQALVRGALDPGHDLFKLNVIENSVSIASAFNALSYENLNNNDNDNDNEDLLEYIMPLSVNVVDSLTWHMRLCHPGKQKLEKIIKMGLLPELKKIDYDTCEHCPIGKMTRKPFLMGERANELLEIVHSDICGPFSVKTHGGKEYFITFIDDYSKYGYVYLLNVKYEAFQYFVK